MGKSWVRENQHDSHLLDNKGHLIHAAATVTQEATNQKNRVKNALMRYKNAREYKQCQGRTINLGTSKKEMSWSHKIWKEIV